MWETEMRFTDEIGKAKNSMKNECRKELWIMFAKYMFLHVFHVYMKSVFTYTSAHAL